METKTQTCSHCKKDKILDDFSKGSNKNGKRSWCKACISEYYQLPDVKKKSNKISRDYYENVGRQATKDFKRDNTQKYLYQSAKARAKQRGEEFTIKLEDIKIPEICPLLGIKMQYNENLKQDNSYSLDRIDSSKGYIPGNIWVVSLRANRIKNDATLEELELIVKNLKQYGRNNI